MNKTTEKELNQLIEAIISERSLQLSSTNYSFNSLVTEQILIKEKDKYLILDYSKIASLFIEKYKDKFGISLHKRFIENISFIEKITKDFKQNEFIPDFHKLAKELWKIIIIESNKKLSYDFKDFISSLDKQIDNYTFIEAYSDSLQELELTPKIFITNALRILDFLQNDGVQYFLFNRIKERCRIDFEYGIKLFEIALVI
ncbi:MAG: hypothetical protein GXO49_05295, partial [Chlorobi bacterium]|nr:hypothetical protein [Chlorobiota bacterium]